MNWLGHYGLSQYNVHMSGHMMLLQLKKAIKMMNAKRVFPVHTDQAQLFKGFMWDLKSEVTLVEKNKQYSL